MAIVDVSTSDSYVNSYLAAIRRVEYGREARAPIASALDRCYRLALMKAGKTYNTTTAAIINEHLNRIRTAIFGEEVRDAIRTGIEKCYAARNKSISTAENNYLTSLIEAQTAEDLLNAILRSIALCCTEVKS